VSRLPRQLAQHGYANALVAFEHLPLLREAPQIPDALGKLTAMANNFVSEDGFWSKYVGLLAAPGDVTAVAAAGPAITEPAGATAALALQQPPPECAAADASLAEPPASAACAAGGAPAKPLELSGATTRSRSRGAVAAPTPKRQRKIS
jgi:hypothetical protein